MILLLKEKVPGLGEVGDVVEISDGYGRNYLIPQRLGVANTPENRRHIETQKLVTIQRESERRDLAQVALKALDRALLQVHMKAQRDGALYGSVTQSVVADTIQKAKGFRIEDRWVQLEEPIKKIGDYDLTLKMLGELEVTFKLTVLPEED
jgi:large subunit ribosomal protein L9